MIRPEDVPKAFVQDGTCRNIYVLDATAADWLALLHLARDRRTLKSVFTIDGVTAAIPDNLPDFIVSGDRSSSSPCTHLAIDLGDITLRCDFIDPGAIELDVDPRELHVDTFFAVTEFMETLGRRIRRNVLFTAEISPEEPFFLYESTTDRIIVPRPRLG
jgi:hypothetical protein